MPIKDMAQKTMAKGQHVRPIGVIAQDNNNRGNLYKCLQSNGIPPVDKILQSVIIKAGAVGRPVVGRVLGYCDPHDVINAAVTRRWYYLVKCGSYQ